MARLATIRADGSPRIVPITFALTEVGIVTVVDHKPKRHSKLARLEDIASQPSVTVLVDNYSDEWDELWWVRVDGTANVIGAGAEWTAALDALANRYPQYVTSPPSGAVIVVEPAKWTGWTAT